MNILVDSSAWIDYFRSGDNSADLDILIDENMIVINDLILAELIPFLRIKKEKEILKQQNIAYENQAEIINQSTESIRSLRHDMKKHLIILREIYANDKTDEIEPYIGKILEQMDSRIFSQSNNFVIDSIINFKLRQLKNKDAQITLDINVPQTMDILPYDLTVILGNLLDNAITAIEKAENKMLNVSIGCNMGNLIILMDNSFNGNVIIENEEFKTTKSFKANHGIGFTSIEKSLENYEGEIRTEYTEDVFSVSVIIPYIY